MALDLRFSVSQSQDTETLYLTDETGDYDASTNTGGYGTPNTARTDLALILVVNYKATAGDQAITVNAYNPETVTQYSMSWNDLDGHFEFDVYPVAKKTGSETPVTGDFVYDFSGDQLQIWNGSSWASATTEDLIEEDATHVVTDYPILANTFLAFNNLNKLFILGCATESKSDLKAYISETSTMLNGPIALFAEQSFAAAQKAIENYSSRVTYLIELT